jgi:polyhydroxyalkanoate synthesis regulator phasin
MTEEEMDKFAEIVAEKVINKIKKNQEEWDKQFQEEMQDMEAGFYEAKKLTDKDKLREEIQKLVTLRAECIESERYESVADIEKKIVEVTKRYNNL